MSDQWMQVRFPDGKVRWVPCADDESCPGEDVILEFEQVFSEEYRKLYWDVIGSGKKGEA